MKKSGFSISEAFNSLSQEFGVEISSKDLIYGFMSQAKGFAEQAKALIVDSLANTKSRSPQFKQISDKVGKAPAFESVAIITKILSTGKINNSNVHPIVMDELKEKFGEE